MARKFLSLLPNLHTKEHLFCWDLYESQYETRTYIRSDIYHHFVLLGGTVELVCTVKNGNEYPILWMKLEDERKNNPVPISTGNKLFFKNSRYSLEFDPNAGSYKLIINDVAKSDEGKYQCQVVTTPENVITADVDVKVKTTPVMKEDAEPVVMQEVNTIKLHLFAHLLSWYEFNSKIILDFS